LAREECVPTQGKKVDGPPLREGDRGTADPRPDQPIRGRVSAPRTDREETWRLPEASDKTARTHGAESSASSHQRRQIGGRDSSLRICVPIRCGREGDREEREDSIGRDECVHRRICAARPMRPGRIIPHPPLAMTAMSSAAQWAGRPRAPPALAFGIVTQTGEDPTGASGAALCGE
jgi:hypothetical protein